MLYIQANQELIDGQYITYCAYMYLFCKVVYDGFLDATACILRFLVPILHVMQRKTAIRSGVHCNINNLYHKYKDYMYM